MYPRRALCCQQSRIRSRLWEQVSLNPSEYWLDARMQQDEAMSLLEHRDKGAFMVCAKKCSFGRKHVLKVLCIARIGALKSPHV